jgi:hypothetical protein
MRAEAKIMVADIETLTQDEERPPVEEIERRIADWMRRLNNLFQATEAWAAKHGWSADPADTVAMHEELMEGYELPPVEQPTLKLIGPGQSFAFFKPRALWVIGANGRVDLYTSKGVYIIIDQADAYAPPAWTLFRSSSKREGVPYSPDFLSQIA